MAKTSGGTNNYAKAGARVIAVTSTGRKMTAKQAAKVKDTSESIDSLKHREVVKQLNRGVSRYEKVMGVRERTIRVANTGNAYGVTFINANGSKESILIKGCLTKHVIRLKLHIRNPIMRLDSRI